MSTGSSKHLEFLFSWALYHQRILQRETIRRQTIISVNCVSLALIRNLHLFYRDKPFCSPLSSYGTIFQMLKSTKLFFSPRSHDQMRVSKFPSLTFLKSCAIAKPNPVFIQQLPTFFKHVFVLPQYNFLRTAFHGHKRHKTCCWWTNCPRTKGCHVPRQTGSIQVCWNLLF